MINSEITIAATASAPLNDGDRRTHGRRSVESMPVQNRIRVRVTVQGTTVLMSWRYQDEAEPPEESPPPSPTRG